MTEAEKQSVRAAILEQVRSRGRGKTSCPSEVARQLDADDWRAWMQPVREVAAELHTSGEVVVTQKGETVDPVQAKGPIRLGLPEKA
ncbi:MAG: DUF3253 domain-containing protein [Opitutales bacterium]